MGGKREGEGEGKGEGDGGHKTLHPQTVRWGESGRERESRKIQKIHQ